MQLRPRQIQAVHMIAQSIKEGKKRPMVGAVTSFGKTILSAYLMKRVQDKGNVGWFFCDRVKLVQQTIEKFQSFGIDFGVRQSGHELHNPKATIQIASIQTVAAMVKNHNGRLPVFDFAIVDEAHNQYDIIKKIIETYDNVPIVGMSATPYSKGLGVLYNNLIVPATPREILNDGDLCPIRHFGGQHIDMSKVRSANANSFSEQDLIRETDKDGVKLTGDIFKNWMLHGERSQTIGFSPSQAHSKFMTEKFNDAGIGAEHIDCYTPDEERRQLYEAHDKKEFYLLSCSQLLSTGYDSPLTRCVIDCYDTKSLTTYVQRAGRIMRTMEGKEYGIYLHHTGNFERFGDPINIIPEEMHDGTKPHKEKDLAKKPKEKKDAKISDCPQCPGKIQGVRCGACGYTIPITEQMIDDGSDLVELQDDGNKANKVTSREDKQAFLAELLLVAKEKGYKKGEGWAKYIYRERFGVWPNKIEKVLVHAVSQDTKNWLKHQNIKRAKSRTSA